MEDDPQQAITNHLSDLRSLATQKPGKTGIVAKDTTATIENLCKNLLDEQLSGAASLLFDRESGLCKAAHQALDNSLRADPSLVELRQAQFLGATQSCSVHLPPALPPHRSIRPPARAHLQIINLRHRTHSPNRPTSSVRALPLLGLRSSA